MPSVLAVPDAQSIIQELLEIVETRFSLEIATERVEAFQEAIDAYASEHFGGLQALATAIKRGEMCSADWAQIIHLATNHETQFFRHPPSLEAVVSACAATGSPKVLSVGCSTGEEAYSIAAVLLDAGHTAFEIVGLDVSEPCVETAQRGVYRKHHCISNLLATDAGHGLMQVRPEVRRMVRFAVHNILSDNPVPLRAPTVVISQNMLIYYKPETRHDILNRLAFELAPGGHLIIGPAEDAGWDHPGLTRIVTSKSTVFVKGQP